MADQQWNRPPTTWVPELFTLGKSALARKFPLPFGLPSTFVAHGVRHDVWFKKIFLGDLEELGDFWNLLTFLGEVD